MNIKKINLDDETFLTTNEVADFLRVAVSTIKKWRSKKVGPRPYKFGGCYRYCKFEILKMIADKNIITADEYIIVQKNPKEGFFAKLKI